MNQDVLGLPWTVDYRTAAVFDRAGNHLFDCATQSYDKGIALAEFIVGKANAEAPVPAVSDAVMEEVASKPDELILDELSVSATEGGD